MSCRIRCKWSTQLRKRYTRTISSTWTLRESMEVASLSQYWVFSTYMELRGLRETLKEQGSLLKKLLRSTPKIMIQITTWG
jgi:hypothetical protein